MDFNKHCVVKFSIKGKSIVAQVNNTPEDLIANDTILYREFNEEEYYIVSAYYPEFYHSTLYLWGENTAENGKTISSYAYSSTKEALRELFKFAIMLGEINLMHDTDNKYGLIIRVGDQNKPDDIVAMLYLENSKFKINITQYPDKYKTLVKGEILGRLRTGNGRGFEINTSPTRDTQMQGSYLTIGHKGGALEASFEFANKSIALGAMLCCATVLCQINKNIMITVY